MADPAERYRKLIDATLRAALAARLERPLPDGLTMELALPAIAKKLGIDDRGRLGDSTARLAAAPSDARVVDGAGQTRSTYRPLLVRSLAPFGQFDAHALRVEGGTFALAKFVGPLLASNGATIAGQAFDAAADRAFDPASPLAADAFAGLTVRQAADGTFLARTSADQLEPAWYHELAVLHAVDLYARQTGDPAAVAAVKRSARYHAEQVQPDHASSHPFGLAALLEDAEGIFLADMMLHAAGVQQPATMDAVSLVLLFDAIDAGQ